jgi:hypothetical protein
MCGMLYLPADSPLAAERPASPGGVGAGCGSGSRSPGVQRAAPAVDGAILEQDESDAAVASTTTLESVSSRGLGQARVSSSSKKSMEVSRMGIASLPRIGDTLRKIHGLLQ